MPPIETSTPAATPFGGGPGSAGWIAFASDRGGTLQIWVMDGSGEQRRQVTNAAKGACQPAWAPGGALLAYITPCSGPRITYPGANIEYIDLASGEVTRLNLPAGGFDPAWSPDGKTLAYTKIINGNSVIYTYSLETKSERALAASLGKNMHPAWSPDGHYIAYTSLDRGVDEIWRMRADGSSQELLTQAGLLKYFSQPAWSPDGQTILAVLKELNVNGQRLVQIDPDAPRRPEEPFYQGDPLPETLQMERGSYSPDGLWVVYWSMLKGNNMEIIRVGVDGSVENLTSHQARDFQPDWAKP
jgi:TolB protein